MAFNPLTDLFTIPDFGDPGMGGSHDEANWNRWIDYGHDALQQMQAADFSDIFDWLFHGGNSMQTPGDGPMDHPLIPRGAQVGPDGSILGQQSPPADGHSFEQSTKGIDWLKLILYVVLAGFLAIGVAEFVKPGFVGDSVQQAREEGEKVAVAAA